VNFLKPPRTAKFEIQLIRGRVENVYLQSLILSLLGSLEPWQVDLSYKNINMKSLGNSQRTNEML
jgi:hypothetical protein